MLEPRDRFVDSGRSESCSRQKLDLRVIQCIREYLDAALVLHANDDDDLEAMLREGGEGDVWRLIQRAIDEAGWQVCSRHGNHL